MDRLLSVNLELVKVIGGQTDRPFRGMALRMTGRADNLSVAKITDVKSADSDQLM